MAAPTITPAGQDLLDLHAPFVGADPDSAFAWWCASRAAAYDELDQAILSYDDVPGWARLFRVDDPGACPAWALPWVCQFAGIDPDGVGEQDIRDAISLPANLLRGTTASISRVVKQTLTGMQTLIIRERFDPDSPGDDSPYHLTLITRTSETSDTALTLAAAAKQKPAGIVLHIVTVDGVSIDEATVGKTINGVTAGVKIDSVVATDL